MARNKITAKNSMTIKITVNSNLISIRYDYRNEPNKSFYTGWGNPWGTDRDGYNDENEIIDEVKSKIQKLIDEQRSVIVEGLKKDGIYE